MGVINLTPNSFSDGSLYNNSLAFKQHFSEMIKVFDVIDIGAESTAPFNDPISFQEEKSIFDKLLTNQKDIFEQELIVSIDTYKPEIFSYLLKWFEDNAPKVKLIWNDVSGVLDEDLFAMLDKYQHFNYVFSVTRIPERAQTSFHMDYSRDGDYYDSFFKDCLSSLKRLDRFRERIIVDPCLGFSKPRELNLEILKRYPDFVSSLPQYSHLIGFSRKSFLRTPKDLDPKNEVNKLKLDHLASFLMGRLSNADNDLLFRFHDPVQAKALRDFNKLL